MNSRTKQTTASEASRMGPYHFIFFLALLILNSSAHAKELITVEDRRFDLYVDDCGDFKTVEEIQTFFEETLTKKGYEVVFGNLGSTPMQALELQTWIDLTLVSRTAGFSVYRKIKSQDTRRPFTYEEYDRSTPTEERNARSLSGKCRGTLSRVLKSLRSAENH